MEYSSYLVKGIKDYFCRIKAFSSNYESNYSNVTHIGEIQSDFKSIKNSEFNIFPNPTTSQIQIKGIEGKANLSEFGIDGKLILSKAFTNNEPISVSILPEGVYMLKISTSEGIVERKLVKN